MSIILAIAEIINIIKIGEMEVWKILSIAEYMEDFCRCGRLI